jgi:hypothetical protein
MIEKGERWIKYGKEIADILGLRKKRDGYYLTGWGRKSDEGLSRMIVAIAEKIQAEEIDGLERTLLR